MTATPEIDLPDWLRPLAAAADRLAEGLDPRFTPPEDGSGRASAVLMAFADTPGGPSVVLTQRAADLRRHPGQVAFPGGAVDPSDPGRVHTALREAEEEIGLAPSQVRIVAELPAVFLARTSFLVTPVLAWLPAPGPLHPADPAEVARVALVAVSELADPANRFTVCGPMGRVGPGFEVAGLFVWGFTAGLIDRLLALGGWSRPWDRARLRELPPIVG